jgi:uncharacterized protein (DUF58 family)
MFTDVCHPEFLKKLDRLRPRVREGRGVRPGDTPIPRHNHPSGTEFEVYKDYAPGDDFRHIDWNALGRLDQLFVRTFTAEREIPFHLLLDTSASMGAPTADKKFAFATDLAAALGYIVLTNNDALRLVALRKQKGDALPFVATPFLRHESRFFHLQPFLDSLTPEGKTFLREAVRTYIGYTREPGVVVLISDFLVEPAEYEEALVLLRARRYEVKALQVLGASELNPAKWFRRGKLYDVEEHGERWVTLTQENLRRYQEVLTSHLEKLRDFCHRHEIFYALVSTEKGLETTVIQELSQLGMLRWR